MIRPTLPRVLNLLRGRWYEIDFLRFRDDLFARTQSLVFQFTINHIHTYKGPIKISEKRFLHLICIFLSVRNLKWVQCNCKNWNQWSYFLEKSFLFTIHQQWNECVSCILFKTCQFFWSYFDKMIYKIFSNSNEYIINRILFLHKISQVIKLLNT